MKICNWLNVFFWGGERGYEESDLSACWRNEHDDRQ